MPMRRSSVVRTALHALNVALHWKHFELVRTWELEDERFSQFIPFRETRQAAEAAAMSLEDYIEFRYRAHGATQATLDGMEELGVFHRPVTGVCEIGPGSGRYLSRVMRRCRPHRYEIYETAIEWREWLKDEYDVIAHEADGRSLAFTEDASMDLVQAHKVFPGLGILSISRYFREMIRVVRPGGHIVCDVLTEECLDASRLRAWLDSGIRYPQSMVAREWVVDLFARGGCEVRGSFHVAMRPGTTETMVFRKV